MDRRIRSIIEELDSIVPERDKHAIIEARADNVIQSSMNLLQLIRESFTEQEAEELRKRLLNSIRAEDPRKFQRKIRQLKEASKCKGPKT